ncbi:KTSC domain-containing protein [Alkalicoccus daliensis]|uniref:KTSC domain-containing protein n=1 Tax=Alkalicoccus daliensis TaxID=745820 RepID=A0A1H0CQS7_9BACI|nr:KTSC domain-containing protein [Alkalicoccus daliensis]SDN60277.1 KTSC domain-containing protein [Alkalicoccus daliensis]
MEWTNIAAADMKEIGFDEELKQLHIRYNSGAYVIYYEVQDQQYVGLLSSDDKTAYFENEIKPKFPYRDLTEGESK